MTVTSGPVRIGVIGCGNVLGAYLAAAERLRTRGEAIVVAACGREAQRTHVTGALGIARFVTEPEALFGDPEVDLVIVLTPMATHAAFARAALVAGKHVLVEKPLATTMEDARSLLDLAARGSVHLVAAPFTPLSPTFAAMAARVRAGEIGDVVSARGRYGWAGPDWTPWFYQAGGGALFDLAVYNVTTLVALLGPVRHVTALADIAIAERVIAGTRVRVEVEDNAQIVLEHDGGCLSQLTSGFTMQQCRSPGLELYGTRGTLQLLGDDWDPDGFELWTRDRGAWRAFKESDPEWPWTYGLIDMVAAIRAGAAPALRPELALHVLDALLTARSAARQGRRLPVGSTTSRFEPAGAAPHEPAHLQHDRTRRVGS